MNRPTKVLCAISHGVYSPWIEILSHGQEKTWLTDPRPDGVSVIHFHGTPLGAVGQSIDKWHEKIRWSTRLKATSLRILDHFLTFPFRLYIPKYSKSEILITKDPALHIHFPDSYLTYRWKELSLFRYFINETSDDFLFMTTTSSYVRLKKLQEFVDLLPRGEIYAGALPYKDAKFISGSNRILSRQLIIRILEISSKFNPAVIEDVALGTLIGKLGVTPITNPLTNVTDEAEIEALQLANKLQFQYHLRLKSGSLKNRNDINLMLKLHDTYSRIGA